MKYCLLYILPVLLFACQSQPAVEEKQEAAPINIIAYYAGKAEQVDSFKMEQLTHVIYSFCHLQGNRLHVSNAADTATIERLVKMKERNPSLKVLLSLGGWGGCKTCSDVFSMDSARKEFALSVKELLDYFNADGIDLDWEYPAIEGYPGHAWKPEDKTNFTELVTQLRQTLGDDKEISFAAGGFTKFLEESIEWKKVMPLLDRVNLMTYDLIHGYSTETGHHTPLYSTDHQKESTDNAVHYLDSIGIPSNKLVIGAAFYSRIFENVDSMNNGLYRPCKFKRGVPYKRFAETYPADSGYVYHWDSTAQAPWLYNARQQLFVTFDDTTSLRLKTEYAVNKKLNGIMFWQLGEDVFEDGLLQVIYDAANGKEE